VIEALDGGTPLSYLVDCLYSREHAPPRKDDRTEDERRWDDLNAQTEWGSGYTPCRVGWVAPRPGTRCVERDKHGAACQRPAGDGTDHVGLGRCKFHEIEAEARTRRVMAKKLSNARLAALRSRGLTATRLSTSPSVGKALRKYHAHSAEHRSSYQWFDALSASRRSAPPEYWPSLAKLLSLRIDLETAMATASGRDRIPVLQALEAQRAHALEREKARLLG
jgi:hypothetical protein